MHLVKNVLADKMSPHEVAGRIGKVPLILGIWGAKGCGKSFNVELCCKALGVEPIVMSAGELEDEWAGVPGAQPPAPLSANARAVATTARRRGGPQGSASASGTARRAARSATRACCRA